MPQILLDMLPLGVFAPEQVLVLRTAYEQACLKLGCWRPEGDARARKEAVARAILQAATHINLVVEELVAEAIRAMEAETARGDLAFRGRMGEENGTSSA